MSDYLDELHHACFQSSGTTSVRVRALRQGIREIIALRKVREAAAGYCKAVRDQAVNPPDSEGQQQSLWERQKACFLAMFDALDEARKEGA